MRRVRAVLQRVVSARVLVDGAEVGAIKRGWLVLLGVAHGDTPDIADRLADKIAGLRAFEDADGKTNLAAADVGAEMLVVSQFTLLADVRRGRRPSFIGAAPPDVAIPLVDHVVARLASLGFQVATGRFGANMQVELVNDGPFTLWLDSAELF